MTTQRVFSRSALLALTLALVGLSSLAKADEAHPLPLNQCYQGSCTPEQEAVYTKFMSSGAIDTQSALNTVYSGACYHRGSGYDGSQAHHGVFFVDQHEGQYYMSGKFAFWSSENPYAAWTRTDAAREIPPKREPTSIFHLEDTYGWTDFRPGQIPIWQYYARQNGNSLYLIGFWGVEHTIFCEMKDNQK